MLLILAAGKTPSSCPKNRQMHKHTHSPVGLQSLLACCEAWRKQKEGNAENHAIWSTIKIVYTDTSLLNQSRFCIRQVGERDSVSFVKQIDQLSPMSNKDWLRLENKSHKGLYWSALGSLNCWSNWKCFRDGLRLVHLSFLNHTLAEGHSIIVLMTS